MILFLTVEYIIYLPYQTFFLEKHHYFLQYSNLQHIVTGNAAICSKFFIFEPGTPSGWKEHVKMYQNPKFHIVCQIWSLETSTQCTIKMPKSDRCHTVLSASSIDFAEKPALVACFPTKQVAPCLSVGTLAVQTICTKLIFYLFLSFSFGCFT